MNGKLINKASILQNKKSYFTDFYFYSIRNWCWSCNAAWSTYQSRHETRWRVQNLVAALSLSC